MGRCLALVRGFVVCGEAAGHGGGIGLSTPFDPQRSLNSCPLTYWSYVYGTVVAITDSIVVGNRAFSKDGFTFGGAPSSGGGIHWDAGGQLRVSL